MNQDTKPLVVPYQQPSQDSLTKYDLGILAARIIGLYLLIHAMEYASYIPNLFLYGGPMTAAQTWGRAAGYGIPLAAFTAAGILMVRGTNPIVRWIFPEFAAGAALTATGRDLQAVAFSVLGVWLIAGAIPYAIAVAMQYYAVIGNSTYSTQRLQLLPEAARLLTQIATGIYLFARAKGLSALWHRLRYAGIAQPPATTNNTGRPE